MIRQDFSRIDAKRKTGLDHRKKQFATPTYASLEYKSRLNFYVTPPTADITLEQFEQWAIDRLRGMFAVFSSLGGIEVITVLMGDSADDAMQYWRNSKPAPSGTNH
jgi:hypothetical protein